MGITAERFKTTTKYKTPCIYAILNDNNYRVYVGESKTPMTRFSSHMNTLKNGTHANKELQNDFNKGHNFTFIRLKDYTEEETESMRYYELKYMKYCRESGIDLYNSETDEQINRKLYFNSKAWEIHCEMEKKRNEYYKKYFGCTYYQFKTWDMLSKRKGSGNYMSYKIRWFNEKRRKEIDEEEKEKLKIFKKDHKKVSFYIKKDVYEKLKLLTDEPEKYINMIIEKSIERGA